MEPTEEDFDVFFNTYIHHDDSGKVRRSLLEYLQLEEGVADVEDPIPSKIWPLWTSFPGASRLKYISRRHGLPGQLVTSLRKAFHAKKTELRIKVQIATAIKYATKHNCAFIGLTHTILCMKEIVDSASMLRITTGDWDSKEDTVSYFEQETLRQLCLTFLAALVSNSYNEKEEKKFRQYSKPLADAALKEKIERNLTAWKNQEKLNGEDLESTDLSTAVALAHGKQHPQTKASDVSQITHGDSSFDKDVRLTARRKIPKAHVVKTQQRTVSSTKSQNISEKTEIQKISLTNALKSTQTFSAEQSLGSTISPARDKVEGSDRSWLRFTKSEIANLVSRAESGKEIKEDDLVWLKNKTYAFSPTNFLVHGGDIACVLHIFWIASQKQRIPEEVIILLAKNILTNSGFVEVFGGFHSSDYESTNGRIKLLQTIRNHVERNGCRISDQLRTILNNFVRQQQRFTSEMTSLVQQIFALDVSDFETTFSLSLKILMSPKGRTEEDLVKNIQYVHGQIRIETRCEELEEKHEFMLKMVEIVQNKTGQYSVNLRTLAVRLITDALHYLSQKTLTSEWHEIFAIIHIDPTYFKIDENQASFTRRVSFLVKFLTPLFGRKQPTVESEPKPEAGPEWSPEQLKEFQVSLVKCILVSLGKHRAGDPLPSSNLLEFLLKVATQRDAEHIKTLALVSLNNLVIEDKKVNIEGAECLAKEQLFSTDCIDNSGCVYLTSEGQLPPSGATITSVSHCVANILQRLVSQPQRARPTHKTLQKITPNVITAVRHQNLDKNTRIICAEILFAISGYSKIDPRSLSLIRPHTLDQIANIRVHCAATFCTQLEKADVDVALGSEYMNWLPNLYTFEPESKFMLGKDNFLQFVNDPILRLLNNVSERCLFSHDIFHLLTRILNETPIYLEDSVAVNPYLTHALLILRNQIVAKQNSKPLPQSCYDAVENVFLGIDATDDHNFISNARDFAESIIWTTTHQFGLPMSKNILCEVQRNVLEQEDFSNQWQLSARLLIQANWNQDLEEGAFLTADMLFLGLQLFRIQTKEAKFPGMQKYEYALVQEALGSANTTRVDVEATLRTMAASLARGVKMTHLTQYVAQNMLDKYEKEIYTCLLSASENRQHFNARLISSAFKNFNPEIMCLKSDKKRESTLQRNSTLLSLAITLSKENQRLPDDFLGYVVWFCVDQDENINDANLAIRVRIDEELEHARKLLSILAEKGLHVTLPQPTLIASHFYILLDSICDSALTTSNYHQEIKEIVRTIRCIAEYQTLDDHMILVIHQLFVDILKCEDADDELWAIALKGMLGLGKKSRAAYYATEDFELIFEIVCSERVDVETRESIREFLHGHRSSLTEASQEKYNILDNALMSLDPDFLGILEEQLGLPEYEEGDVLELQEDGADKHISLTAGGQLEHCDTSRPNEEIFVTEWCQPEVDFEDEADMDWEKNETMLEVLGVVGGSENENLGITPGYHPGESSDSDQLESADSVNQHGGASVSTLVDGKPAKTMPTTKHENAMGLSEEDFQGHLDASGKDKPTQSESEEDDDPVLADALSSSEESDIMPQKVEEVSHYLIQSQDEIPPLDATAVDVTQVNILNFKYCHTRLVSILKQCTTSGHLNTAKRVLRLVNAYPTKLQFCSSVMDTVASMSVTYKSNTVVQDHCNAIITHALKEKVEVSEALTRALEMNMDSLDTLQNLLCIVETQPNVPVSPGAKCQVRLYKLLVKHTNLEHHSGKHVHNFQIKFLQMESDFLKSEVVMSNGLLRLFLQLDEMYLTSSSMIPNFLARSYMSTKNMDDEANIMVKLARVFDYVVMNDISNASGCLLASYKDLAWWSQNKSPVLMALTTGFYSLTPPADKQLPILHCIAAFIKHGHFDKENPTPLETVQLVLDQLQNTHTEARYIALDTLTRMLDIKLIHIELVPQLAIAKRYVFTQIFGNMTEAEAEMDRDKQFAKELLLFLYSLAHWDLKSLRRVKHERGKWKQILSISNLIACFSNDGSLSEKIELALQLSKVYKHFGSEPSHILATEIGSLCHSAGQHNYAQFLESLSYVMELSFEEANQVLQSARDDHSLSLHNILGQSVIAKILKMKFDSTSLPTHSDIMALSKGFIQTIGPRDSLAIVKHVSKIERKTTVEEFLNLLEKRPEHIVLVLEWLQAANFQKRSSWNKFHSMSDLCARIKAATLMHGLQFSNARRMDSCLVTCMRNGISEMQLSELATVCREHSGGNLLLFRRVFEHLVAQMVQFKVGKELMLVLLGLLQTDGTPWRNAKEVIDKVTQIINKTIFESDSKEQSITEIVAQFSRNVLNADFIHHTEVSIGELETCLTKIIAGKFCSLNEGSQTQICQWAPGDMRNWAAVVRSKVGPWSLKEYEEALAVTNRAAEIAKNYTLRSQQILACYLALANSNVTSTTEVSRGLLEQVSTGSGKSAIIAVLSVVYCLSRKSTVDVYTSSGVLAQRDAKQWARFYLLFDLSCDHNGDKINNYVSGPKPCYKKNIVYGDCAQFQFDYLRHNFSDLGTRGNRECSFAIVDEVDSMFIDDSSKLARLSSPLPGMDLLQTLYHFLWDRLMYLKSHMFLLYGKRYFLDGEIRQADNTRVTGADSLPPMTYVFADKHSEKLLYMDDIVAYIVGGGNLSAARIHEIETPLEEFVKTHLTEYMTALITSTNGKGGIKVTPPVPLPKCLFPLATAQIPNWVESALTALQFQENVHYIVDGGLIKPVDFRTTGIVQASTSWNNGLQQFLQIKHCLRVSSETVTTNFLSNMAMFRKYGPNLVGFTGTLGGAHGRNVLADIYSVHLVNIPDMFEKQYIRFPDVIAPNEAGWLSEIMVTALEEASKGRGVLIICETINLAEEISRALKKFKTVQVKVYTRNQDNQEKNIERIHPGDIIVATNLAGRGTDILTNDIEQYGGLHVCLTFLPESLRVEEQALGRTSRQGNQGSGQLILNAAAIAESTAGTQINESNSAQLMETRDEMEKLKLEEFLKNELPIIRVKDELFSKFCSLFAKIRNQLQTQGSIWRKAKRKITYDTSTYYELIVLQAAEEKWANFLRQLEGHDTNLCAVEAEYKKFEEKLESEQKTLSEGSVTQLLGENVFCFIQLGNDEYAQDWSLSGHLEKAKEYYDKAIRLDRKFAAGAFIGNAYVLLKGSVNAILPDTHMAEYKDTALGYFHEAVSLLNDEMAMITLVQLLTRRRCNEDDALLEQLTEKSNLVGTIINNVKANIAVVEKSLRRVLCTCIKPEERKVHLVKNECVQMRPRSVPSEWGGYEKYDLSFHSLTVREDSGTRDQAVCTLSTFQKFIEAREKKAKSDQAKSPNVFLGSKPVSLSQVTFSILCPNANLVELATSVEGLLKIRTKVAVELHRVNIPELQERFKEDPEIFQHTKEEDVVHSYVLEMNGAKDKVASALLRNQVDDVIKGLVVEVHYEMGQKTRRILSNINDSMQTRTQRREQLEKVLRNTSLKDISIKVFGISSIRDILLLIEACGFTPLDVSISIIDVRMKNETLAKIWNTFLHLANNIGVRFLGLSADEAKRLVSTLRNLKTEFVLGCHNLPSLQTAATFLEMADIAQEEIQQTALKKLEELFMADRIPFFELMDLRARGLAFLVTFNEKQFVPWISIAGVMGLAALQMTVGAALMCTVLGSGVGLGLLTEGASDLFIVQRVYSTREFSWSGYRTQKAVSVAISVVSAGLSHVLGSGAKMTTAVGNEAIEQVATRVLINGKEIAGSVNVAIDNLSSLAAKKASVTMADTVGRIAFKSLADTLSDFCFEQLRGSITKEVSERVSTQFSSSEFKKLLSYFYAIEEVLNTTVGMHIDDIMSEIVSSKTATWTRAWDTVGLPLCTGVLSDRQFLGSTAARLTLAYGFIRGVNQIGELVVQVCDEIKEQLTTRKPSFTQVLQQCGLSKAVAKKISDETYGKSKKEDPEDLPVVGPNLDKLINPDDRKTTEKKLKTYRDRRKKFNIDSAEMSQIMRKVVDQITSQIIRVANSHLVSPVMSQAGAELMGLISKELQDRFIWKNIENSAEQNLIQEKVDDLKKKPKAELTPKEKTFLKDFEGKNAVKTQVQYSAKEYFLAWQRNELLAKIREDSRTKSNSTGPQKCELSMHSKVEQVLNGEPGDVVTIFAMAAENGLNLKIVSNPSYKQTASETAAGLHILVHRPGVGYSLLNTNKSTQAPKDSSCAYEAIGHLTGKSVDELRLEACQHIVNNSARFDEIRNICVWMRARDPEMVDENLLGGGGVRKHERQVPIPMEVYEQVRLKFEKELGQKPIVGDGLGWIYFFVLSGDSVGPDGAGKYKIGISGQPNKKPQKYQEENCRVVACEHALWVQRTVKLTRILLQSIKQI